MTKRKTVSEAFQGRIGIIGAGAMGGFYGARLFRAGHDVHFLMRSDYDTVKHGGLVVNSYEGDFQIQPPVYRSAREMGGCDLLIVGLKTTDNAALPGIVVDCAGPETVILTLQNGLGNEEAAAEALGAALKIDVGGAAKQVLGGVAFICSNRIAPGVISHTDHGWIRMSEFVGAPRERTHAIAALFASADIDCRVVESVLRARWEKLVWNVPFNGLGVAAGGADTATVLADVTLSACARGLMEEIIAAAKSDKVEIDAALADKMMQNTTTMGSYKTSMQLDYEAGRPMEVEAIVGEPLRRAKRAGIAPPRLEILYGVLSRLNQTEGGEKIG